MGGDDRGGAGGSGVGGHWGGIGIVSAGVKNFPGLNPSRARGFGRGPPKLKHQVST